MAPDDLLASLTRYSLSNGSLRPHPQGEFVAYSALEGALEREREERQRIAEALVFPASPSVRARVVAWIKSKRG